MCLPVCTAFSFANFDNLTNERNITELFYHHAHSIYNMSRNIRHSITLQPYVYTYSLVGIIGLISFDCLFVINLGMHDILILILLLCSFNGLFSRTTWVSQNQKSRTILAKPIWIYWSKR